MVLTMEISWNQRENDNGYRFLGMEAVEEFELNLRHGGGNESR
jgi:hypothetical protein